MEVIPGTINLKDGSVLKDIHRIVVCTGYHCSYPFLADLHQDSTLVEDAGDEVLVTDGTQVHNPHKDIFYIPNPTLSFVGGPYYSATFTFFEFQAIVVAAVLSRRANLPLEATMRRENQQRLETKGCGRRFHLLRNEEVEYVKDLTVWVNMESALISLEPIEGHTEEWHAAKARRIEKMEMIEVLFRVKRHERGDGSSRVV